MSYSVIMPWTDSPGRAEAFARVAEGYIHWFSKHKDVQIVLIDDGRGQLPACTLDTLWPHFDVRVERCPRWTRNSAAAINWGVSCSTGTHVVLTSPEVLPNVDYLGELDIRFKEFPDAYHVLSCGSAGPDGKFKEWYQHSVSNARALHFLSAMSRNTWCNAQGFDERFCFGSCYEDNDFYQRVKKAGIAIHQWDHDEAPGSHSAHLHHEKTYALDGSTHWETNRNLYIATWETPHA